MADFIKTLWSDGIIQELYEDNDLRMLFNRDLESYARSQGGNKIVLPILSANSSSQRTDNKAIGTGLPLSIVDVDKTATELSIYEHTYGPINMRKIDDVQSNKELMQYHVREIAQVFKEQIFTDAVDHVLATVHNDHKLPWTGAPNGSLFSFNDVKTMKKTLNDAKIPKNNRFLIIDNDADDSLQADDYLKNWLAVQQNAISSGVMPQLQGFGMNPSAIVTATGGKKNVIGYRKDFLHLVIQTEMEITGSERAEYLGFVASFTTRYGILLDRSKGAVVSTQQ